ncbi:MAG: DUF4349 domain-containing protein [Paludibacter sp.]|nr:DUF4349 domain-containing protein [Paludibacter sp.]
MKQIIQLVFIALLVVSCDNYNQRQVVTEMTSLSTLKRVDKNNLSQIIKDAEKTKVIKKKIIKDGSIDITVNDLEKTKTEVDALVTRFGGYCDNEKFYKNEFGTSYHLKIRIPCSKFESFIANIQNGKGEITSKEISARDVTDQFIDMETRLANKQNYLTRYQELLKKANSIKEILDIQEKIRVLGEEIESTTGQLKYLNDLVDFSTLELTINLVKDYKYIPAQRMKFMDNLKQSFSRGWYGFIDFLFFLLSNWVFVIILAVLVYYWIKYRKRRKIQKQKV